jgi:3-oxoacyl-[acyl-carrier protein] reductase
MSIEKQIALVTGASRGIGKAIAEELAAMGAIVIGTATSEKGAQAITESLSKVQVDSIGMVLNVSDADSVAEVTKSIAKEMGAITILVNNAGITKDNLLMRMKEEEWNDVISTNLSSIYRMSKAVLRGMMKAKGGRIINVSSVVGSSGNPGQTNYCASKAGINGFTRSLAQEIGSRGITVNAVAPGFIESDMTDGLPDEQKVALKKQIPLARLGQPKEIAETVAFLASKKAAYISGQTIHVNGGMYMS